MGMRISTNISAITANRNLIFSQRDIQKTSAQLSSGSRITKAADDAAGLAISENLKSQMKSYTQAGRNANDGVSMVQTAEGGLNEISTMVTRLREIAIQAASDTISDKERVMVDKEVQQLKVEMQRIAQTTKFGTTNLLDGSGDVFDFQIGINNKDFEDRISYMAGETDATVANLGVDGLDFTTKTGAQDALASLDDAQSTVNGFRANLGALQNRLQSTTDNLAVMNENISAANSRIRDTDIAQASSESVRNNILLQAATSTLAQANQTPGLALKLLG